MLLLSSGDFFQNQLFQKILSGTLSECQTVWIQIRTDILLVLIWVQTVCKCNQQTTKVAASMERVKHKETQNHISHELSLACYITIFNKLSLPQPKQITIFCL